ncbi:hypothetical protein FOVG_03742 [Fusarium oxysporum f. sp. pisi HDV247]|uniref:Uncharacterized protein n=1 Tax=Fusarium oxysporum f. sp. pisi HDV247 TaxID=1080344 RepID=W9Q1G6_FUSOX|nr:hypothetical protein FOVG_03742 [Fusarium oxysporum f. sp. pisi HDV247]
MQWGNSQTTAGVPAYTHDAALSPTNGRFLRVLLPHFDR